MGRTRTVDVAAVAAAYRAHPSVAFVAAELHASVVVVRRALRAAGVVEPARARGRVVHDLVPNPLTPSPRVTVAVSRAQLLVAQTAAARDAVRRGDQAGADRALGAVTAGLRLIARSPADLDP